MLFYNLLHRGHEQQAAVGTAKMLHLKTVGQFWGNFSPMAALCLLPDSHFHSCFFPPDQLRAPASRCAYPSSPPQIHTHTQHMPWDRLAGPFHSSTPLPLQTRSPSSQPVPASGQLGGWVKWSGPTGPPMALASAYNRSHTGEIDSPLSNVSSRQRHNNNVDHRPPPDSK